MTATGSSAASFLDIGRPIHFGGLRYVRAFGIETQPGRLHNARGDSALARTRLQVLLSGYAYREPSFYAYKKNFAGTEYYDWREGWKPFTRGESTEQT